MTEMIRVNPAHLNAFPTLEFPFEKAPEIWAPEKTVLRLSHGKRVPVFVWCHLERHVVAASNFYNPASLSAARVAALPEALRRLAEHFRLRATSARTIYDTLSHFGRFLAYLDKTEHTAMFEQIISDSDLALHALELHHRYLKAKIQTHGHNRNTAANQQLATMQVLSVIHKRQYADEF